MERGWLEKAEIKEKGDSKDSDGRGGEKLIQVVASERTKPTQPRRQEPVDSLEQACFPAEKMQSLSVDERLGKRDAWAKLVGSSSGLGWAGQGRVRCGH